MGGIRTHVPGENGNPYGAEMNAFWVPMNHEHRHGSSKLEPVKPILVRRQRYPRPLWEGADSVFGKAGPKELDVMHRSIPAPDKPNLADVYLGGVDKPAEWRTKIAIPRLERAGLSCYNPFNPEDPTWDPKAIGTEVKRAMSKGRILLYVISGAAPGVCALLESVRAMEEGRRVVLVLEEMESELELANVDRYCPVTLDDLNKARAIVAAVADGLGVPVFSTIREAVVAIAADPFPPRAPHAPNVKQLTYRAQPHHLAVFLGGSTCGSRGAWREEVAIPLLERYGISYFNPQEFPWDDESKERCRLRLYVIDHSTTGASLLVEAAHAIIKRKEVLLVVQAVRPSDHFGGEEFGSVSGPLHPQVLREVNRARAVLWKLAEEYKVRIFPALEPALEVIVDKEITYFGHIAAVAPPDHGPPVAAATTSVPSEDAGELRTLDGDAPDPSLAGTVSGQPAFNSDGCYKGIHHAEAAMLLRNHIPLHDAPSSLWGTSAGTLWEKTSREPSQAALGSESSHVARAGLGVLGSAEPTADCVTTSEFVRGAAWREGAVEWDQDALDALRLLGSSTFYKPDPSLAAASLRSSTRAVAVQPASGSDPAHAIAQSKREAQLARVEAERLDPTRDLRADIEAQRQMRADDLYHTANYKVGDGDRAKAKASALASANASRALDLKTPHEVTAGGVLLPKPSYHPSKLLDMLDAKPQISQETRYYSKKFAGAGGELGMNPVKVPEVIVKAIAR